MRSSQYLYWGSQSAAVLGELKGGVGGRGLHRQQQLRVPFTEGGT